ncbi:helix-turn-helix transcriptional regulator [Comamonas composti]|uniref:helix-turn-helix transcriptional regulator n=1 Tax=Comamonas composti TaxID=408558 RepID=UPI00047CF71B|nr:AraC family transcriptional regulator [Comamonas composti]
MQDCLSSPSRLVSPAMRRANWRRSELPSETGRCFTDHLTFDDGLTLAYASYLPTQDLSESSVIERTWSLTLTIALQGQSNVLGANGQRFDFVAGHSTLAAFASTSGQRRFAANQPVRQLRLIVEAPLLHKYGLHGLLPAAGDGNQSPRHLFFGKHGTAIRRQADSLVHLHEHAGSLLELQIAALGLLAEHTRAFMPPPAPAIGKLSATDQELMLRARAILRDRFNSPLTIAYLCAAVGTNEFKLKQGFRALFGTSPHRMLTDIRMRKAWELLESGLYVSTVAYQVGYKHLSSFSAAFEHYYGRPPKSVAPLLKSRLRH